jgi:hypothetical protein
MSKDNSLFGCFVKTTADSTFNNEEQVFEKGKLFRTYIFGEKGIDKQLKEIRNIDYGSDLELILFQFYVYLLQDLEPMEYRKREKSIGIPIVIDDKNFFDKSEEERYSFLKQSIFQKLDLLAEVVKKKKLDTKMEQLKTDLQKLLN